VDHPPIQCGVLQGRRTYLFEDHATALLPWAFIKKQHKAPLKLITLDHHTDANSAYLRDNFSQVGRDLEAIGDLRRQRVANIDITNLASVTEALKGLHHDEHIDLALRLGIIEKAFVIQHEHAVLLPEWAERHIVVLPVAADPEQRKLYDAVLEDDFLTERLQLLSPNFSIDRDAYILDIDLDVFKTHAALKPKKQQVFTQLVANAKGITIATEPNWVRRLFMDSPMSTEAMLAQLGYQSETGSHFPVNW
jgi:hypothetical protein